MILPHEEMDAAGPARFDHAQLGDPELLGLSRDGDAAAFAELFARHRDAAVRIAARTSRTLDPEDVAAEAFARVWTALSRGRGPDHAFRPYLAAAVRNVALNWCRGVREVAIDPVLIEDAAVGSDAGGSDESATTTAIAEAELVDAAFAGLPERWRKALWATEVEGRPVQEVARDLGISANAASALCLRAREGLRTAWLQAHVQRRSRHPECQWVLERLGAHTRRRLPAGQRRRVDAHLDECARCTATRDRLAYLGGALKVAALFAGTGATALAARAAFGTLAGGAAVTGAPLTLQPVAALPSITSALGPFGRVLGGVRALGRRLLGYGIPKLAGVVAAAAAAAAVVTVAGLAQASADAPDAAPQAQAAAVVTPASRPTTAPTAEPTPTSPSPEPTKPPQSRATVSTPSARHSAAPRTTPKPTRANSADHRPSPPTRSRPEPEPQPHQPPTTIPLPKPPVEPGAVAQITR